MYNIYEHPTCNYTILYNPSSKKIKREMKALADFRGLDDFQTITVICEQFVTSYRVKYVYKNEITFPLSKNFGRVVIHV